MRPKPAAALQEISVALATFNGERFLSAQLESLARQDVPPAELVACDDCSSDSSVAILEEFAGSAPFPVRIFRNESNLGFTANFMGAAERCTSPLIAFCDQDDIWEPNKISTCARFFADHPGLRLLVHAAAPVDEDLRHRGKAYPDIRETRVLRAPDANAWQMTPGFAMVCDRSLLEVADWRERPPSRDLNGSQMDFDEWLYFVAWATGDVGFVADRLVMYRQHDSNYCGAPDRGIRVRLHKLLNEDFATHVGRREVARAYAEFLEEDSSVPGLHVPDVIGQISAGARYWRAYEAACAERDAFYEASRWSDRVRRFAALVERGAYRGPRRAGFGYLGLARDVRELVLPRRELRPVADGATRP